MTDRAQGPKVLLIDADPSRERTRASLESEGFSVKLVSSRREGVAKFELWRPDVVILDLEIKELGGPGFLESIRTWSQVPVIAMSGSSDEMVKVRALDAGADDYLLRPVGMLELAARVRVALRHLASPTSEPVRHIGNVAIDFGRRCVTVNNREVHLRGIEYDVLKQLVIRAGSVVEHDYLLEQVWGAKFTDRVSYIRPIVTSLRKKLGAELIETLPGVGYRLAVPHNGGETPSH